jgi:hypothetical protein
MLGIVEGMQMTQTIKVTPEDAKDLDRLWNWLIAECPLDDGEWIDIYNNSYIEGSETVIGEYEKPVFYGPNGDGYPGGFCQESGVTEDWLEDEIKNKLGIKVKVSCEFD